jgi:hypothetical protein
MECALFMTALAVAAIGLDGAALRILMAEAAERYA